MRPPVAVAILGLLAGSLPGGLAAQDRPEDLFPRGPSQAGIGLDSILVAASAHPTWKGFVLGSVGGRGYIDFHLAGRPVSDSGDWGLTLYGEGMTIADPRPRAASEGHVEGGLVLSRFIDPDDAAIRLVTNGYWLPKAHREKGGLELGLELVHKEINWGLEEVNPEISGGIYQDFGHFDGLRVDVDLNLGLGIQNFAPWGFRDVGAWIETHASWSDYGDSLPGASHDRWYWHFGLGGEADRGLWALSLRTRILDARASGLTGWSELAFRIYPEGRPR